MDGIRKCLCRPDALCQPRQGPKLGRKRRWRGFPGAPSGAGRGVSPRIPRIGAELGAWSRPRPADEARGRRGRGDMFGRGSYAIVRRCKSSIFFRCNPECGRGVCVLADTLVFVGGSARRCALPMQRSLASGTSNGDHAVLPVEEAVHTLSSTSRPGCSHSGPPLRRGRSFLVCGSNCRTRIAS